MTGNNYDSTVTSEGMHPQQVVHLYNIFLAVGAFFIILGATLVAAGLFTSSSPLMFLGGTTIASVTLMGVAIAF